MKNNTNYRMDIITKKFYPKSELIKITKLNGSIVIDLKQTSKGRSAYFLLDKNNFILLKKKNLLSKSLKIKIDESIYNKIEKALLNND